MEQWIRAKYEHKQFAARGPIPDPGSIATPANVQASTPMFNAFGQTAPVAVNAPNTSTLATFAAFSTPAPAAAAITPASIKFDIMSLYDKPAPANSGIFPVSQATASTSLQQAPLIPFGNSSSSNDSLPFGSNFVSSATPSLYSQAGGQMANSTVSQPKMAFEPFGSFNAGTNTPAPGYAQNASPLVPTTSALLPSISAPSNPIPVTPQPPASVRPSISPNSSFSLQDRHGDVMDFGGFAALSSQAESVSHTSTLANFSAPITSTAAFPYGSSVNSHAQPSTTNFSAVTTAVDQKPNPVANGGTPPNAVNANATPVSAFPSTITHNAWENEWSSFQ